MRSRRDWVRRGKFISWLIKKFLLVFLILWIKFIQFCAIQYIIPSCVVEWTYFIIGPRKRTLNRMNNTHRELFPEFGHKNKNGQNNFHKYKQKLGQ